MAFYSFPQGLGSSTTAVTLSGENRAFGAAAGSLRVASLLGNTTGIADFGSGVLGAQTLRVVIATDQPAINVNTASVTDFGASTAAGRVAALLGNVTGIADFGSGAIGAQTLRVGLASDQLSTLATETTLGALNTKVPTLALNYGVATAALRVASQLGNASGIADFGSGVIGAQTLRVGLASDQLSTLATETTLAALNTKVTLDYGAATAGIRTASQLGNATGALTYNSGAADAQTLRSVLATRHEAAATPLSVRLSDGAAFTENKTYVTRFRNDYSSVNVTTGAFVSLGTVSAAVSEIEIFDSSGQTLEIGVDPAGGTAFVSKSYIFPGGNGRIPLVIASGSSVGIKAVSASATAGEIDINLYG